MSDELTFIETVILFLIYFVAGVFVLLFLGLIADWFASHDSTTFRPPQCNAPLDDGALCNRNWRHDGEHRNE